ncbi:hypothetical protein BDCR2A_01948 [Borrelia duttonii CR2A]|uniref:Uncharacterized protein n=1 Tax=Borrelia duttonii CR2A TaxID=1432657 RepID=W6TJ27_9SPIR|nr:hypothetical protein BDCR2A_01948 [Borrelia duttonii CR2A]
MYEYYSYNIHNIAIKKRASLLPFQRSYSIISTIFNNKLNSTIN